MFGQFHRGRVTELWRDQSMGVVRFKINDREHTLPIPKEVIIAEDGNGMTWVQDLVDKDGDDSEYEIFFIYDLEEESDAKPVHGE